MSNIDLMPDINWEVDPFDLEKQELLAIQNDHNTEMRHTNSGIFDHALSSGLLTDAELHKINDLTLATVHVDATKTSTGLDKRTFKIRFATPDTSEAGVPGEPHISFVEVAHKLPLSGAIIVLNGFSEVQGLSMMAMANDLHDARNSGVIPNISASLSSVNPQ